MHVPRENPGRGAHEMELDQSRLSFSGPRATSVHTLIYFHNKVDLRGIRLGSFNVQITYQSRKLYINLIALQ